jgi:hypothetical protein
VTAPVNNSLAAADSTLAALSDITAQIAARIAAITLADGTAAFPSVAVHDLGDLLTALKEMVVSGDRAAVILVHGESWQSLREGRQLVTKRVIQFSVLAVDTNQGNRQAAVTGLESDGSAVQIGSYGLRDLLLGIRATIRQPWLLGWLNSQTYIRPTSGAPLLLRDDNRKELAGRAGWIADFEAVGGRIVTDVGAIPID